jgi:uncharacterized damage-inducible protein DinB
VQVSDLDRLYAYHYWANNRLLSVVKRLSPEEFTRSVAGSYGSVRNTLVHVLSAEWGWLDRCGGPARGARLNSADYPSMAMVLETWERVEGYMRAFLATLEDADLLRNVEFSFGKGPKHSVPVGELLQHGAVHAVHHRGQVALLLRMLGHAPGDFDLLYFASENPRRSEP